MTETNRRYREKGFRNTKVFKMGDDFLTTISGRNQEVVVDLREDNIVIVRDMAGVLGQIPAKSYSLPGDNVSVSIVLPSIKKRPPYKRQMAFWLNRFDLTEEWNPFIEEHPSDRNSLVKIEHQPPSVVLHQLHIKNRSKAREFGLFFCQSLCISMLYIVVYCDKMGLEVNLCI